MSVLKIRRAFEKAASSLSPEIDTFFENSADTKKPTAKKPYQKLQHVPFKPENPTYGDGYYREVGEFQIFLCYPAREGTGKALQKAEALRDFFFRGSTLVEDGLEITISKTPSIEQGQVIEDRYLVPVIIEYFASVLKT